MSGVSWLPWRRRSAVDELVEATESARAEIRRRLRELSEASTAHKAAAEESRHTASRPRERQEERDA